MLEEKIKQAVEQLDGELAGKYMSLNELTPAQRKQLIDDHILFNDAESK